MRRASTRAWVEVGLLFAFFLVCVAIRAYHINILAIYPDELTYSSRAVQVLGGGWAWPKSSMYDQPPLLIYILAAVMAVGGSGMGTLRLVSVVAGAAAVPIVYFMGKSMYGTKAGVVAAVGVAFDRYQILYSRLLYIEALASTLILGAALFFWEGVIKRRDSRLAAAGGVVLGLAMDSKYIALVAAVAFAAYLIWYRRKLEPNFPTKQVFLFFGIAVIMFIPILVDLAANNANPFYYDLVYRFQLRSGGPGGGGAASGQLILALFSRFSSLFFRVPSSNPAQNLTLLGLAVPLWSSVVVLGILFFGVSLLLRRRKADGLLFLLFVLLLGFALTYPDNKAYFYLYPSVVFLVMMGGLFEAASARIGGQRRRWVTYASLLVIGLIVGSVALNVATTQLTYQQGFGDYDEITPIMNYIKANPMPNDSMATSSIEIAVYAAVDRAGVSVFYMRQATSLYTQPPALYNLQSIVSGTYPIYWVISPEVVIRTQPEYVVMPNIDYQSTTANFKQFLSQYYFQPLNTRLILIFQLRN